MRVTLGNTHPLGLPEPAYRVTTAVIPDSDTEDEAFRAITDPSGVWANHSIAPTPAWVDADDSNFAERLADHYGIPVGRPADWEDAS